MRSRNLRTFHLALKVGKEMRPGFSVLPLDQESAAVAVINGVADLVAIVTLDTVDGAESITVALSDQYAGSLHHRLTPVA